MSKTKVNVHEAKTHFSRLLARVERGERITVVRAGKPVARMIPAKRTGALPPEEPLLNLDRFGFNGPGGQFTIDGIDSLIYGG